MKYDFHCPTIPSFFDIRCRVQTDPPSAEAAAIDCVTVVDGAVNAVRQLSRFQALDMKRTPFTRDVVQGMRRRLLEVNNDVLSTEPMAICHQLETLLDAFDLRHPPLWASLSPSVRRSKSMLEGTYLERHLHRLFHYCSARAIDLALVNDEHMPAFLSALELDPSIENPVQVQRTCKYAWNNARRVSATWPGHVLKVDRTRIVKGMPWNAFPQRLHQEIENTLEHKPRLVTWDAEVVEAHARVESGLSHAVELIRICISHLAKAGVVILRVADIVSVENFKHVARALYTESDRQVTRLVRTKLATLRSLCVRSELLAEHELNEIEEYLAKYITPRHKVFCKTHPSRIESRRDDIRDHAFAASLRKVPLELLPLISETGTKVPRPLARQGKQYAMLAILLDSGFPLTVARCIEV